ncbi:zinc carboxypeptidase A 1-like [Bicyclus anynana]|uniref:Zinc carboxypeptidase A 1-like n=1 Tax=Bicyclus anynana TaxID=110368 RepID=A0ABM3LMX4_BICAN|nr:zinc carboxypeptidase A 1-like [Bicyclus anynana]
MFPLPKMKLQPLSLLPVALYTAFCTVLIFRRKRANTEYTRWHANPETKPEFIVKVLEDDVIPTSESKYIAAVNIQPITQGQDKIIIRGVQVTNKDSVYENMLKEYTRFVPPTTRISVEPITEKILHDHLLKPKLIDKIALMRTTLEEDVKSDEKLSRKFNIDDNITVDKELDATVNDVLYDNDDDIYQKTTLKRKRVFGDDTSDNHFNSTEDATDFEESEKDNKSQQSGVSDEYEDYGDSYRLSYTNETNNASETKKEFSKTNVNEHHRKNLVCNVLRLRPLSFSSPLTLHEIVAQMKQWAAESPVAKWLDITKGNYTVMENPIYMMLVDDLSSGQIVSAKKTVMIVAGIQGRDHHAVTAAMYVLYQLIERSDAHTDLLSKFRFWVIPVFNPDGYDYSMTFPHRRQWSKNLRQSWDICKGRDSCEACEEFGIRCTIQPCYGVNLDRNFEYQWIPTEELRMEHPCGTLYAGPRQLSEAETAALTRFLHEQRVPIYAFVAFKEGDVLGVMYPYSHTKKKRAFDHVYRQRASQAASAAYSISGRPYVAGQTSEFLPLYAGGIEDWVDGHLGIDNTYTVMLFRPTDTHNSKLVTERVVHEAYAAVDTLLLQSVQGPLGPPLVTMTRASEWRLKPPSTIATTSIFVVLIILGHG